MSKLPFSLFKQGTKEYEVVDQTARTSITQLNSALIYSNDETIIGKWTNGADIYRKVIEFRPIARHTSIDISNIGIKHCISIRGLCSQTFNNPRIPIPFYYSPEYYTCCGLGDLVSNGGNQFSNIWVDLHSENNVYLGLDAIIIVDYLKE